MYIIARHHGSIASSMFPVSGERGHFSKYKKLCRKNSVGFQSVPNLRLSALNWQIITSYIELVYQIYVCPGHIYLGKCVEEIYQAK